MMCSDSALEPAGLRILMVCPLAQGGISLYSKDLCQSLSALGAHVTLLTSVGYSKNYQVQGFELKEALRGLSDRKRFFTKVHWLFDRLATSALDSLTRNFVAQNGWYDILHLQRFTAPVDQFLLRSLSRRLPVIVTAHDTIPHDDRFAQRRSFIQRVYRYCDCVISHYERGRDNLAIRYGVSTDRIAVIPHGLTMTDCIPSRLEARGRFNLSMEAQVILFFGSIRPDKGLQYLLRALAIVKREKPDLVLIIAGRPDSRTGFTQYASLIRTLGIQKNVVSLLRFIEDDEVPFLFAAADCCALPYERFDSQSGVLMQAYVHYIPVLATDVGGMGELVKRDGIGVVVAPGDVACLANGLRTIIQDHGKYLRRCGPETTKKHCWIHSAKLTLQCYEQVLTSRRSITKSR